MGRNNSSKVLTAVSFISCTVILSTVTVLIFNHIYREQNFPYIDEIFHVPQAQLYCENQWTKWNPKITTLPGLYIVSYVLLKPFEIFGYTGYCSLYNLRAVNIIGTVVNFFLAFRICSQLENKYKIKSSVVLKLTTAFNISIFPPLYFFTFLYYTDIWSLTFVLMMYQSHLSGQKLAATLASVMSVLMRQTNIIWVGLMILDEVWNILSKNKKQVSVQDSKYTIGIFKMFVSDYFSFKKKSKSIFSLINETISKTYHYIIVCSAFVGFVILNGAIVLGDKEAHKPTLHPMQNLYFLDFLAFFSLPFFISEGVSLLRKPPNIFLAVLWIGLCAGLSEVNKLEHPYLLADNRHLAFYLWKRLFGHSTIRRMLVPTYVCSAIILLRLLKKRCHFMFAVALSFCTFLNLTPQFLFELRYFIAPFVMHRLQFKSTRTVYVETVFFLLVNAVVFYLFLHRPFVWPSEPQIKQRFVW